MVLRLIVVFKGEHQQFGSMDTCVFAIGQRDRQSGREITETADPFPNKKHFSFYLNPIDRVLLEFNVGLWAVLDAA